MRRLLAMALAAAAVAACGGDGGGTQPVNTDVTGSWTVSMSPMRGHGLDCQIVGLQVDMTQAGTDLSGTYTADDIVCNGQHSGPGGGTVVSGTNNNGSLHFHFDTEDFDMHGVVRSSSSATGNYTLLLQVDPSTSYTFTGTWSAHR